MGSRTKYITSTPGRSTSNNMEIQVLALAILGLVSASPLSRVRRQTANEVALRIVAVSDSKPELLSTAVSKADPDLLRVALTDASPNLLRVALNDPTIPILLATALTRGVKPELLL